MSWLFNAWKTLCEYLPLPSTPQNQVLFFEIYFMSFSFGFQEDIQKAKSHAIHLIPPSYLSKCWLLFCSEPLPCFLANSCTILTWHHSQLWWHWMGAPIRNWSGTNWFGDINLGSEPLFFWQLDRYDLSSSLTQREALYFDPFRPKSPYFFQMSSKQQHFRLFKLDDILFFSSIETIRTIITVVKTGGCVILPIRPSRRFSLLIFTHVRFPFRCSLYFLSNLLSHGASSAIYWVMEP